MSDYTEHLISMAGGDGDELDAIQARAERAAEALYALSSEADSGTPFAERHFLARNRYLGMANAALFAADVPALLAIVRDQAAKLGRVEALADSFDERASQASYFGTEDQMETWLSAANHIRAAITVTEAGK